MEKILNYSTEFCGKVVFNQENPATYSQMFQTLSPLLSKVSYEDDEVSKIVDFIEEKFEEIGPRVIFLHKKDKPGELHGWDSKYYIVVATWNSLLERVSLEYKEFDKEDRLKLRTFNFTRPADSCKVIVPFFVGMPH